MRSKDSLDKIIRKGRAHLYKPIQIAEILHHYRTEGKIKPSDIETYRNASKRWRDEITKRLVGRASTSSQKYQDNIFDANAMPPAHLAELARFNKKNGGVVEAYIYHRLKERLGKINDAEKYLETAKPETFRLEEFLERFTAEPGLRRSIDKVYEIIVYALFSTIMRALRVEVSVCIKNLDKEVLADFKKFVTSVIGLSDKIQSITISASIHRVGVTNAADRGLDMWANFGPAIQVKHLSLTEDLAEDVVENVSADKIVLVCLDGEAETIRRILTQLSFSSRIQSIITVSDLTCWYELCLSAKYKKTLGAHLLQDLLREFKQEFPSSTEMTPFIKERKYDVSLLKGRWALTDI